MRVLLFAALALAAGCGKTLSEQYCAANPTDMDCRAGGLTIIDAPPTCTMDDQCTMAGMNICDLTKGACVECSPDHTPTCPASAKYCGTDDHCHECVTIGPNSPECGGGYCTPNGMCSNDIAYATPMGDGTTCTMVQTDKCTLTNALKTTHHLIVLDPGTYSEGPITIARDVTIIGSDAMTTIIEPAPGDNSTVITVTAGTVVLDSVSVANAQMGSDGIACTGANLTFHLGLIHDNTGTGIRSTGCTLVVDRSQIYNNDEAALIATDSPVAITNNFVYGNGDAKDMTNAGAVRILGASSGALRYNSIAFNLRKKNYTAGLTCDTTGTTVVDDNIIAGNNPGNQYAAGGNCTVTRINFIQTDGNMAHFVKAPMMGNRGPTDLHLKMDAPKGTVIDNPQAICIDVTNDIDGDARPQGMYCDLGGDEYK